MAQATKTFQIRIPVDLYALLEQRARDESTNNRGSMSQVAIQAIAAYLSKPIKIKKETIS